MEAVAVEETTAVAAEGMLTIAAEKMTAVIYCKIPTGWPPRPGRKKPLVVPEEKTIASGFRFYVAAISAL